MFVFYRTKWEQVACHLPFIVISDNKWHAPLLRRAFYGTTSTAPTQKRKYSCTLLKNYPYKAYVYAAVLNLVS